VIGVVLAGNGADGKEGLRAIQWPRAESGVLQEAEHAVYSYASPSVWRASQVRHADYCLPLDDIAELLRSLIDGNELRSD